MAGILEETTAQSLEMAEMLEKITAQSLEMVEIPEKTMAQDQEVELVHPVQTLPNRRSVKESRISAVTVKRDILDPVKGIIPGAANKAVNDGHSHWMKDKNGWWLRYSDGSYAAGKMIVGEHDNMQTVEHQWEPDQRKLVYI